MKFNSLKSISWRLAGLMLAGLALSNVSAKVMANDIYELEKICLDVATMMNDHILLGMGIDYHDPAGDIQEKAQEVDAFLADLQKHSLSPAYHKTLDEIAGMWKEIKPKLLEKSTLDESTALRKQVWEFDEKCEHLGERLVEEKDTPRTEVLELSAEMGDEIEEISNDYLLRAWGDKDPKYYDDVGSLLKRYDQRYHKMEQVLKQHPDKTVMDDLHGIDKNFMVFKVMAQSKSGRYVPMVIAKNTQAIMSHLNHIISTEKEQLK